MKIYIVKHGEYEYEQITLVTFDIDKACKHLIETANSRMWFDEINGIEVWENEKLIINYGGLNIHLLTELSDKELRECDGWIKIKNDMLKFINEIKDDSNG